MAQISRYPFFRHLRSERSRHLIHFRGGKRKRSGRGLAFWFLPMTSSVVEAPTDDRDLPFLFHARSRDFQDVTVQGAVTYRGADPEALAERVDFTVDLASGRHREQPLDKIADLFTQRAQQLAIDHVAEREVRELLAGGLEPVRERIAAGLIASDELAGLGLEIAAVGVASVAPSAELEKALQTPALEEIQQSADQAMFERRAVAVEKERAIAENELENQIELAAREARLIEERAVQGRATLDALLQLARRIDAREAFARAWGESDGDADVRDAERVSSLRALEGEIVRTFGRSGYQVEDEDRSSPAIEYGFIGAVLHPGANFSAEDVRLGRGEEGAPVPGSAALFRRMNRFALVGNGAGQGGPDATVQRVVGVEARGGPRHGGDERAGEHLGRPFRGTVFWCQGADVPGRFGRLGAGISGAALHEGYYLDIGQIAAEQRGWIALAERFVEAPERAVALSVGRAPLDPSRRTEVSPALGAGDRMRLAVLESLAGIEEPGTGRIEPDFALDHLTHVVATHEEGHLCDRAGWYPLSVSRVMSLISFAGAHGFSGQRIARALEERAQLIAVAACRDPRVPIVDLLDAAEEGGASVTPHGAAYRRVLARLVERLEKEYLAGEWDGADLQPDGRWIDQLHRLDPEALRGLAIREARARGLARN